MYCNKIKHKGNLFVNNSFPKNTYPVMFYSIYSRFNPFTNILNSSF